MTAATTHSAPLAKLAERYWRFQCAEFPLTAIMAGETVEGDVLMRDAPADHERRAVWARQALAELDGTMTRAEAQEQTTTMTRRFARRQESWFGPDPRIAWLDPTEPGLVQRAVALVRAAIGDNGPHG